MKYRVEVTETVNHSYLIEASSVEEALDIYNTYDDDQLKELDQDGSISWDSPWDVVED